MVHLSLPRSVRVRWHIPTGRVVWEVDAFEQRLPSSLESISKTFS